MSERLIVADRPQFCSVHTLRDEVSTPVKTVLALFSADTVTEVPNLGFDEVVDVVSGELQIRRRQESSMICSSSRNATALKDVSRQSCGRVFVPSSA